MERDEAKSHFEFAKQAFGVAMKLQKKETAAHQESKEERVTVA